MDQIKEADRHYRREGGGKKDLIQRQTAEVPFHFLRVLWPLERDNRSGIIRRYPIRALSLDARYNAA